MEARYGTREEWLKAAASEFETLFAEAGHSVPRIRIGVGFPSAGRRSAVIGECWTDKVSGDGTFEIIIRIDRTAPADPQGTLSVLLHEMAHAVDGLKNGHNTTFGALLNAVGLEGKATASVAGPALMDAFAAWVGYGSLGAYPMADFRADGRVNGPEGPGGPGIDPGDWFKSSGPKTQTTRMLKAWCPNDVTVSQDDERSGCGYTVRMTRKWADVGLPTCPNPECERKGMALELEG